MKILLGIALISLIVAINAQSLSLNKRAHFPFKIDKVNNDGTATIISPPTRSAEHYLKGSQKSARDTSAPLVGGSSFGSYFIDLTVGTPSQTLQVVVDTGSTTLVLGSASCMVNFTTNACTLPNQNGINYGYSMNTSSSAKYVSCGTSCYSCTSNGICEAYESYGDGSSGGGYMVQDVVSLTPELSTNSYIANLVYEYNVYGNPQEITNLNSDGIMGLAYPVIGNNGFPSVFDSLVSAGKVDNIFGLYLEQSGGRLDLGTTDTSGFGSCNTHYTPLQMEEYYNIQVNSLSIAGNTAQFPAGPNTLSIVDSGTTFMLVPDNVYQTLMQGFQDFCSEHSSLTTLCSQTNGMVYLPSGYCTGLNQQDLDDFSSYPEISLTFPSSDGGEFSVSIGGNAYILYQETTQLQGYQYCGSIGIASTGSNSMSLTILGDSFMKGVYTIFDRQNQKVGFCGKTQKKNGKILAIAIGSAVGGFCFCGALVAIAIIVHRRRKHHHYHPLN